MAGGGHPALRESLGEKSVAGQAFDPDRQGPAVPVEGAVSGGTATVLSPFDRPPHQILESERGRLYSSLLNPEWFGDPVVDAVRLRPRERVDGVGP